MDATEVDPPPVSSTRLCARRAGPIAACVEELEEEQEETLRRSSVSIDVPLRPALVLPSPRRTRRPWAIGGAALVAAVIAVMAPRIGGLLPRIGGPVVAAAVPASEVNLTIQVRPTAARIFLDGVPVSAGAYDGKLAKDNGTHRIRVEAPGFVPMEQSITASADMIVSLALEREARSQP